MELFAIVKRVEQNSGKHMSKIMSKENKLDEIALTDAA